MTKWLPVVGRVLLGGMFVFSGSNGFFHFVALPPPEGDAGTLFAGFAASGYMLPLIFGTQLLGGLLVLSGRLTPVGLVLVSKGPGMGLFLTAVELALAFASRAAFLPMFAGVTPAASAKAEPAPIAAQPAA